MQPIFASCAKIAQTIFKTTLPNRNLRLFICNLFSMRFSTSRNRFYFQSVREISHCRRPGRYSRHILYPRTSRNTRHSFPRQYIDTLRLSLFVPGNFSRSPVFYGSRLYRVRAIGRNNAATLDFSITLFAYGSPPVPGQIVVLVFPYSSLFLSKSIITPYPIYGIIEKTMTYLSIPDVFPCPKKSDNNYSME